MKQRIKKNYKKLLIILLSRLKETKKTDWEIARKKKCDVCPFNTKNMEKISIKQYLSRIASNALTFITTGKFNEDNSECSLCTCTLTYKQAEPTEKCDDNQWEK